MFDVNQFTIIGKYIKLESHRDKVFLFIKINDNKIIKFVISKGIQKQLAPFCLKNETMAIKGYISSDSRNIILLYATKLFFSANVSPMMLW